MKLFGPLYQRALTWSRHPKAPALLGGLSFAEAIVFPVMPEVMLAPMCLAQPQRAFRFASISLLFSLLGAVVGYLLGHYAYEVVKPMLAALVWLDRIDAEVAQLREIVASDFDMQQKIRQMEIDDLRAKLSDLEAQVHAREDDKDALLRRRVEDLVERTPRAR